MRSVAVKICGLTRRADAEAAADAGAEYLGLVFAPGRRTVAPRVGRAILDGLASAGVGVFVNAPVEDVVRVADIARLRVVQLHGDEDPDYVTQLRRHWDGEVWKALRPRSAGELLREIALFSGVVHAALLDAWSAAARGGTGETLPWAELAPARAALPADLRLVLAGGLRVENVATGIEVLAPDVVDVSSGVEVAPGEKDGGSIHRFIREVRSN